MGCNARKTKKQTLIYKMDYFILYEFMKSQSVHLQFCKGGNSKVKFREVTVSCVNVKGQAADRLLSLSTQTVMRCLGGWRFFSCGKVAFLMGPTKETPCVII
jgi:hypothetical protein